MDPAALGLGAGVLALVVIGYLIQVIAYWKVFVKAGKPGWHSIIPILNVYDQFDICWKGIYGIIMLIVVGIGSSMSAGADQGNTPAIAGVLGLIGLIIGVVGNYKLARSFGKGLITFLGLVFLEPLFMLILGFGGAQYRGKR